MTHGGFSAHHQGPGEWLALSAPPTSSTPSFAAIPGCSTIRCPFYSRSAVLGILISVLILFGRLGDGVLQAAGQTRQRQFVRRPHDQSALLMVSGQLHPVYNLTSARLVLGNSGRADGVKSRN